MTNTINNVPRELLADLLGNDHDKRIMAERHLLAMLANAPSPAGVDGLEVVGYISQDDIKWQGDCTLRLKPYSDYTIPLCRLSDAQAIIDGLRGEVARYRAVLDGAKYPNLDKLLSFSVEDCRFLGETVASMTISVQSERYQQAQRIGELEGLLRDSAELIKHGVFEDGYCCCGSSVDSHGLGDGHSPVDALAYHAGQVCECIDAALAAGKEGDAARHSALSAVCAAAPNIATTSEHSSQPERDPCPMCIKGGICNTPTCGRLRAMPKAY